MAKRTFKLRARRWTCSICEREIDLQREAREKHLKRCRKVGRK